MKFLVLVLSLGVAALARPDVSHLDGYHYKPPKTSYGVPVDNRYDSGHHHQHVTNVPSGSYLPGNQQLPHAQGHINFLGGSSGHTAQQYDGFNPHLIQDQKHVYYYAAPDEEERPRLRIHITPNNQKNTNVIFVKAPNYAPAVPEIIAPESQAEERTKVFVLVKEPEQPQPISIHAPTPVKSKPEVYVVKYNNQDEAERAISGGRGGHPIGVNVHHVGDEDSFVKTLQGDPRAHLPQNDKYSGFDGNIGSFGLRGGFGRDDVRDGSSLLGAGNSGSVGSGHVDSVKFVTYDVSGGSKGVDAFGQGGTSGATFEVSGGTKGGNVFPSGPQGGSFGFGVSGGNKGANAFPQGGSSGFEVSGGSRGGDAFSSGPQGGSLGTTYEISGGSQGVDAFSSGPQGGSFDFQVSGGDKAGNAFSSGSQGGSSSTGFQVSSGTKGVDAFSSGPQGGSFGFQVSGGDKAGNAFSSGSQGGSSGTGFQVTSGTKGGDVFSSGPQGGPFGFEVTGGNKGPNAFSSVSQSGSSGTTFEINGVTKDVGSQGNFEVTGGSAFPSRSSFDSFSSRPQGSSGATFELNGVSKDAGSVGEGFEISSVTNNGRGSLGPTSSGASLSTTFGISGVPEGGAAFSSGSHGNGGATFEVSGKDGSGFTSSLLEAVEGGNRGSGTVDSTVRFGGADSSSGSSILGTVSGSAHTKYGPPGVSGPY